MSLKNQRASKPVDAELISSLGMILWAIENISAGSQDIGTVLLRILPDAESEHFRAEHVSPNERVLVLLKSQ